jgi:hypothetical protein
MNIDRIGQKTLQQTGQIKSVKPESPEISDVQSSAPTAPVKPETEDSIISQVGVAARSISGEDLAKKVAELDKPIAEAVEMVLEQREE